MTPFARVYVPAWGNTRAPVVEVAGDVWRILAATGRVHDVRAADVRLDYRVFYYKDPEKGSKVSHYEDGSLNISEIAPRESQKFETTPVALMRQRPLPASQCKGGT